MRSILNEIFKIHLSNQMPYSYKKKNQGRSLINYTKTLSIHKINKKVLLKSSLNFRVKGY